MSSSLRHRVQQLVLHVERGAIFEALDAFYADNVRMQENIQPATHGKAANVEREKQFLSGIAELHGYRAASVLVDGTRSVINWVADFRGTDGKQYHFDQLAVQEWDDDGPDAHIVYERFVYDSASLVKAVP